MLFLNKRTLFLSEKINQLCDANIQTGSIQFEGVTSLEDKKMDYFPFGKRNLDLHGYTKLGSLQASRRLLLLLDKTHPNIVKFNVGIGSHSEPLKNTQSSSKDNENLQHVTRLAVKQVCQELNLPEPEPHPINKGYLIERVPTSVFNEAS